MKVLVTGARGMLGQDLCPLLKKKGHEVIETDIEEIDITQKENIHALVQDLAPEIIINCAAYTQVDRAEQEPEKAFSINALGVQNLALVCRDFNVDFMQISTDYVFSGEKTAPYTPFDSPDPLSVYGLSKLAGEKYLEWICRKYYIVRTSWLYGINGRNFVSTIMKLGQTQKEIKVVTDQIGSPTWTVSLSRAVSEIIKTRRYGIYHVSDYTGQGISWFTFAQEILRLSGSQTQLIPCETKDYYQPAKRPKNSVLDLKMTQMIFPIEFPTWKQSINDYFSKLKEAE